MSNEEKKKIRKQKRAFPIEKELVNRREYSDREVGFSHPDLPSFIRLNDQGDIEIFAAPGVGIVISARSKSISMFGDALRIFVKEDGFRWNNQHFNYSSTTYIEPALLPVSPKTIHSAVNGVEHFLDKLKDFDEEDLPKEVTISPDFSFGKVAPRVAEQKYSNSNTYDGLSIEEIGLIEAYSSDYSESRIKYIIKLLKEGYEFEEARKRALEEVK